MYVVASEDTVDELQRADHSNESQKYINELRPLWRLLHIIIIDVLQDLVPARDAGALRDSGLGRCACGGRGGGSRYRDGGADLCCRRR